MKYIVALVLLACVGFFACTKDVGMTPQSAKLSDTLLFSMVTKTTNQYSYKANNGDTTFTSASFGGHPAILYSMRVNKKAFDAMTAAGKLPDGGTFPDSSLIVKKLYSAFPGTVDHYAVMFKDNGAWVWAKYQANGDVIQSFKADASACTGCHPTGNKDHVNTFGAHP